MPSAHPMMQIQNVCKTFDGGRGALEVLRDIRFTVAAGEFISIIGPSGCGKTTLLRILHGLEPTTSGEVSVSGKRVKAPSPSSAMVFQQFNLFPWLTVARNISFGLEVAKLPAAQRKERTDRFVRLVGLEGFPSTILMNCPAACSSASASRARSPSTPTCCCWTSRSGRSTPSRASSCNARSPSS